MAGDRQYTKLGAKRSALEQVIPERLNDASVLAGASCHSSAIVAGLYAVEITLKVAVCKRLELDALPIEFQIHDFKSLLVLSGLSVRIQQPEFLGVKRNWDNVLSKYKASHVGELRYTPSSAGPRQVKAFLDRLQKPPDGLIPWLSTQA